MFMWTVNGLCFIKICYPQLTVLIVLALQINQNGSDVMSFQRDGGGGIRFKTEVTAEKVLSDPGEFGGYRAQDLEINGDGQPVMRNTWFWYWVGLLTL